MLLANVSKRPLEYTNNHVFCIFALIETMKVLSFTKKYNRCNFHNKRRFFFIPILDIMLHSANSVLRTLRTNLNEI